MFYLRRVIAPAFFFALAAAVMMTLLAPKALANEEKAIIGKFKVIKANCGGESFLWKKQDKVISIGDSLFIKGDYVGGSDFEENCRYKDQYRKIHKSVIETGGTVEEVSQLEPVARKVYCLKDETFNDSEEQKQIIKTVSMGETLKKVTLRKVGNGIEMKISEFELCDGEVTLELAHDRY